MISLPNVWVVFEANRATAAGLLRVLAVDIADAHELVLVAGLWHVDSPLAVIIHSREAESERLEVD